MVTKKYCWLMLLLAIILEITGTALMKFFAIKGGMEGYILMLLFIFCSYFALSKAIVKIPISTAYAIWEGIGLIGTATVAYFIFNEDLSLLISYRYTDYFDSEGKRIAKEDKVIYRNKIFQSEHGLLS